MMSRGSTVANFATGGIQSAAKNDKMSDLKNNPGLSDFSGKKLHRSRN
jgi:hypothetical protein